MLSRGKNECSLLRDKIKLEEEKKPLMFSLFLIWVSESLGTFFDNFGIYNIPVCVCPVISSFTLVFPSNERKPLVSAWPTVST